MFDELASAIAFQSARPSNATEIATPLVWRLAAPLIGSTSIGLWMLVGKVLTILVA